MRMHMAKNVHCGYMSLQCMHRLQSHRKNLANLVNFAKIWNELCSEYILNTSPRKQRRYGNQLQISYEINMCDLR